MIHTNAKGFFADHVSIHDVDFTEIERGIDRRWMSSTDSPPSPSPSSSQFHAEGDPSKDL